jgi:hypothetical protein
MDVAGEPESVFALYGPEAKQPGTFAANCLLARRMAERDVRFIQLYHPGWDHHGGLPGGIRRQCQDVDRGCYALIDYVNFKGEGILSTERYQGHGWGLLQVLEHMSDDGSATQSFAAAAAAVLRERVRNAPPERHEARWLPGWLNRVATYRET